MKTGARHDEEDILLRAAEWIVRHQDDDFSRQDAEDLAAWLAENPRHEHSYQSLLDLWTDLPWAASGEHAALLAANDDGVPNPAPRRPSSRTIRAVAAAGIAAVLAVSAAAYWFKASAPLTEQYATEVAQISKVVLADGSVVTLAPRSAISVTFSSTDRHVTLRGGEAFFEVTRNSARPFVVDAGTSSVRVVGTHFNVKRTPRTVGVSVVQGAVRLLDKGDAAHASAASLMRQGDYARVESTAHGNVTTLSPRSVDPRSFGAIHAGWREGWLVYDNALLADIVDDLNRYYRPGVVLADPRIGQLRVTASFRTNEISRFLLSMKQIFPVETLKRPGGAIELSAGSTGRPAP